MIPTRASKVPLAHTLEADCSTVLRSFPGSQSIQQWWYGDLNYQVLSLYGIQRASASSAIVLDGLAHLCWAIADWIRYFLLRRLQNRNQVGIS